MELNLLHYTFTGDVENDGKGIGGGRVEESEGGSGGNGGNVDGEGRSRGNVGGEGGEEQRGFRGGAGGRGRGRYKNIKSSIPTLLFPYNICVHLRNISTIIVFNTQNKYAFLPQTEMQKEGKLLLFAQT